MSIRTYLLKTWPTLKGPDRSRQGSALRTLGTRSEHGPTRSRGLSRLCGSEILHIGTRLGDRHDAGLQRARHRFRVLESSCHALPDRHHRSEHAVPARRLPHAGGLRLRIGRETWPFSASLRHGRNGRTPRLRALHWRGSLLVKSWIVTIPGTTKLPHMLENSGAASVASTPAEFAEVNADLAQMPVMVSVCRRAY